MTINSSQKEYANLHTFLTFDEQTHNVRLSYLLINDSALNCFSSI